MAVAGSLWVMFNGAFNLLLSFGPVHLQSLDMSATEAGLTMSIALVANGVGTLISGTLSDRVVTPAQLMALSCVMLGVAIATFATVGGGVLVMVLAGLGSGLPVPTVMATIVTALPDAKRNLSMGLFYLVFYGCLSAAPLIAGWIGDIWGSSYPPLWMAVVLPMIALTITPKFFRLSQAAFRD